MRIFARAAGADLSEAAHPPEAYPSISAFFSRSLKPGIRRWPADQGIPASPVDGLVGRTGRIRDGELIQAKGMRYTVEELLASPDEAPRFHHGFFVTLYLSPRHYHRIHAPSSGEIRGARVVPGALLPVNAAAVASIPRLFPRNERLAVRLVSGSAEVAVVAVGAFNVGRISAVFDPEWGGPGGRGVTNRRGLTAIEERVYRPPIRVERGEEIMAFHLGSTVVLLFSDRSVEGLDLHSDLVSGREIQLGQPLFKPLPEGLVDA